MWWTLAPCERNTSFLHPYQAVLGLLLLCTACVDLGECLVCHCTDCEGPISPGHIWATCATDGACYTKVVWESSLPGNPVISRGCSAGEELSYVCAGEGSVCCHGDRCNGKLLKGRGHLRRLLEDTSYDSMMSSESMSNMSDERTIAIITSSVCVVLITAIVSLVVTFAICCLYFYRGNHRAHGRDDAEAGRAGVMGNCCSAIIPQGQTISSLLNASHYPANSAPSSSLSLLVQRAIVKNTSEEKLLESGQFCHWSLGRWRGEAVMVKTYAPRREKMWFSETEIHQVPHIHHPNILTFIGADYLNRQGQLRHYLITEYHERGSLRDYLHATTLDVAAFVVLAQSAACGLAHLHTEVKGSMGEKPSIVHRNIASRSFFVKNDGTCCLGDLSLAVKDDANFADEVKEKPLGHPLYLSPEVLESWASREQLPCDMWRKADVYALGLVMWEIARRCLIQGYVENAALPFSAHTSSDHVSLEEMRRLVCSKKIRPTLAEHWSHDEIMQSCIQTLTECWHDSPSYRPSAMSAKNSLDKLLPNVKFSKYSSK